MVKVRLKTKKLDNEAPLASLESTYSEFPSMISANYAGLKNDEEDQSRDADQDEEKKE